MPKATCEGRLFYGLCDLLRKLRRLCIQAVVVQATHAARE